MTRYVVTLTTTDMVTVTVDAADHDEAVTQAIEQAPSLIIGGLTGEWDVEDIWEIKEPGGGPEVAE